MFKQKIVALLMSLAAVASAAAAEEKDAARFELRLKKVAWTLQLSLPGFDLSQDGHVKNGVMFQAENQSSGLIVSAFLEKQARTRSAADCRNLYQSRHWLNPLGKFDVVFRRAGDAEVVEWTDKEFGELKIHQRNVFMYLWRDRHCVDVHMSKVMFTAEDEELFREVMRGVKFSDEAEDGDRWSRPVPLPLDELSRLLSETGIRAAVLVALRDTPAFRDTPDAAAAERLLRVVRTDVDPVIRVLAVAALLSLGRHDGLEVFFANEEPAIRFMAVVLWKEVGGPAVDILVSALGDPEELICKLARNSLVKLPAEDVRPALRRAAQDPNPKIRDTAAEILAVIGDPDASPEPLL